MFTIDVMSQEVDKALADLESDMKGDAAEAGMDAGADRAVEIAKGYAPVDTGLLQSSIKKKEVSPRHAIVHADPADYPDEYYAYFQEYGTRYQPGTAFMRPTVDSHSEEIAKIVLDAIVKAAGL